MQTNNSLAFNTMECLDGLLDSVSSYRSSVDRDNKERHTIPDKVLLAMRDVCLQPFCNCVF